MSLLLIIKNQPLQQSSNCKSYIRRWTAAPCGGGRPAAGLSVLAARLVVTLDVMVCAGIGLRLVLGQIDRRQRDGLHLQHDDLLAGVGGDVAGVALRAAVLHVWAAHTLHTHTHSSWVSARQTLTVSFTFSVH